MKLYLKINYAYIKYKQWKWIIMKNQKLKLEKLEII